MKKGLLLILSLILICGCSNNENSLVKNDYINKNSYDVIYSDLEKIINDINYIPSKEVERNFYEMMEVISDNCSKFSDSELNNLYNLMNNNYQFKYSKNRYTNNDFQKDLKQVKECLK